MTDCIGAFYTFNEKVYPAATLPPDVLDNRTCLYEVVRVVQGRCLFPEDHIRRLTDSVRMAGMAFHLTLAEIQSALNAVIASNSLENGNLRMAWKQWEGMPVLYIWPMPFSYPDPELYRTGVQVSVYDRQRQDPNIKKYVKDYQHAMNDFIASHGVYEALLTDGTGNITEGSRTNVFFVKGGRVLTAPGDKVLKGITRGKVLELCGLLGIPCDETHIPLATLQHMEAVFLTGTSPRVLPVRSVDAIPYPADHPLVLRLMEAYDRLTGMLPH
jgi:branched-chain amino acid aminotransferase